ncbi:hypothetical protein C8N43_0102 [Litoreibacter ponti]|uniref:Uncharacterized protein n=1 Tax=Litoreibacter ponti TaxID=1510457 RepID=A0A2T6BHD2_9RHOB|nr:hypothetical protein [Litoreibacter ponti]PTX55464.1 hypothetical protein C8N43_0102 [Litoreibacter ponti]
MEEWRQMRAVFSAAIAIVAALSVWAVAQTERERLSLSPYANLYALQQNTSLDLGFLPQENNPGFGGEGTNTDITFDSGALSLDCINGSYVVASQNGLLVRADLFCPTRDIDPETVVQTLEASGFSKVRDFAQSPRRPKEWGRRIDEAFAALAGEPDGGRVTRIPLSRWERSDGLAVSLGAAIFAPSGNQPMLEIDISIPKTCLLALSVFSKARAGGKSWTSPLVKPVRQVFGNREWAALPDETKYALAAKAADALCDT